MKFWHKVFAITWKDIISETRSREIIISVIVFALLLLVIFQFAFEPDQETMRYLTPGILWVTFAFSGVLSLNRAFIVERESGCIEALLVSPVSREAIYVGKVLGSFLFMVLVEMIVLIAYPFLFNLSVISGEMIIITLLTTIGFVSVGTLFAAMAVRTKARELVLPILFYPIVAPLIITAVKASGQVLAGDSWKDILQLLEIIIAFDVIFVTTSYLIFNYVIEE